MTMTLWLLLAAMTGAAVLAVLWPLSRRRGAARATGADAAFYRDQIAEIDRDLARGLISPREAETARAEAARRLLRAASVNEAVEHTEGEPALRRRRAASALALSLVPLVALAVYGAYGAPGLPAQPLAARSPAHPTQHDMAQAVVHIEAQLAKNPEDGRGWEVIAPVYMRTGRFADAAKAYEALLRTQGPAADRFASLGEALVSSEGGIVSAQARAAFERAAELDPALPKAGFYLARAAEQDGDREGAARRYQALIDAAPADAPWVPLVRQRLASLNDPAASIAALPQAERDGAIRGMVESLTARLDGAGGSVEEWARLVRARTVLGEPDRAAEALAKARRAYAGDAGKLAELDGLLGDLKVEARP